MFEAGTKPEHTRFALKVVEDKNGKYYGPLQKCKYLSGWMKNVDDDHGFCVPTYDNLLKPYYKWGSLYRNWVYDIMKCENIPNIKLALVEVGNILRENTDAWLYKDMRIVKVYDIELNYENVLKMINRVKKKHPSIYFKKYSETYDNKLKGK